MARVIVFLFFVLVVVVIVKAIIHGIRSLMAKREPWTLREDEDTAGQQYRYVAHKPGHKDRVLTPWFDIHGYGDTETYETWVDAQEAVSEMNYRDKRLK